MPRARLHSKRQRIYGRQIMPGPQESSTVVWDAICCVVLSLSLLGSSIPTFYRTYKFGRDDFQSAAGLSRFLVMATSTILIELIPLLMVPLLYRRGIQNWFDFCEQLRAEHKRHAMFVRSERGVRIDNAVELASYCATVALRSARVKFPPASATNASRRNPPGSGGRTDNSC